MPAVRHGSRARLLAWAGIAVLTTFCLFFAGAWQATYYVELRIWALVPAFGVLAAWVVVAAKQPTWRPRTVLAPAFGAAFLAFAVATITSREPRLSVEYLALAIVLTSLYLLLQRLMTSAFFRPRMIGLASGLGVLIGLVYVVVVAQHWIDWWSTIGKFAAPPLRPEFEGLTLGNPSAVMTASVLLTATAVAFALGRGLAGRLVATSALALCGVVTIMSGSRAGWLAVAIAVVVTAGLWLSDARHRSLLGSLIRSRAVRFGAVPVVVLMFIGAAIAAPGLLLRFGAGGETLRTAFFASAVRMFESSPLVGTGPGTWVVQRVAYTDASEIDYYVPHAHNLYLQTLAEFGVAGAIAGLVVVALLGRLLLDGVRSEEPTRRRVAWAAVFTTVYFGAHQLLDLYAHFPAILLAFAIPIAYLDGTAEAGATGGSWSPAWAPLRRWLSGVRFQVVRNWAGVASLLACGVFLAWSETGAFLMRDGTALLNDRNPDAALTKLEAAVAMDPAMPPYRLALGLALADTGDLAGAERQFAAAAQADGLPQSWLDLAAVRARQSNASGARDALLASLRLGRQQSGVALAGGVVALEIGDRETAIDALTQALLLSPSFAGDPWWTADPARASVWPEVYRRAIERSSPTSVVEMSLEAGDVKAARAAIPAIEDAYLRSASADAIDAWEGDAGALERLIERAHERPSETFAVNWCARLLRRAGDTEAAGRFANWAETIYGEASIGGYEVRVWRKPASHIVAGVSTLFYGHYTYRRPVPSVQLVDWLPELGYE
jgi:O-antigen ligase/tetratricopeptide (TPR) repeat protein